MDINQWVFIPLFWGWGDVQTEEKCVPGKTNSVYNSLKQTWSWGSEGRAGRGKAGLVRRQQAEQGQWQQCADTGHWLQTMQQQGCPGRSSDRTAPTLLPPGRRAGTCNSVPRKILVSPTQGHPRQVELFRRLKGNRHLGISSGSRSTIRQLLKKYYFQKQKWWEWGGGMKRDLCE